MTLQPQELLFDRAAPAPERVEIGHDSLRTDGALVQQTPAQRDRLRQFESELRALVPRVRALADQGVDLATQSMHAEAGRLGLSPATRDQLDRKVAEQATRLKQRIATSRSTRDWHGDALDQYVSAVSADLLPLISADLGQQAVQAALSGDTQAALTLSDNAVDLATGMKSRLRERMQALRPQVAALCPSIRRLIQLQVGLTDAQGRPLQLLETDP